ncbi:TetR/AcrR family transcriptional regulator [Secundilactobacillus silagei]|uniref:TetR/AcrR family transcriptional regulator n=1 Tax=Secundilactobacillus silagei TaxID=1293415 RepID=UPI002092B9B1|nr:TetR/AcrR family transcriptional regulator [Secundilactobacillus silagei]
MKICARETKKKRARILDSTSKIMMEQGIAAVSLSKIAKDAGIASGTVYTYFKDKDDLLRGVYYDRKKTRCGSH